jgi:hypothetical protein
VVPEVSLLLSHSLTHTLSLSLLSRVLCLTFSLTFRFTIESFKLNSMCPWVWPLNVIMTHERVYCQYWHTREHERQSKSECLVFLSPEFRALPPVICQKRKRKIPPHYHSEEATFHKSITPPPSGASS